MAKVPNQEEQRLKAFFRDTILTEPGMSGEVATQLADRCVQQIDKVLSQRTGNSAPADATPQPPQFDPFAFSAVSVFARKGRDALLARLGEIASAEDLREFANAQHIAIDQTLTTPDDLRLDIIRGTERRIAARRAAAS